MALLNTTRYNRTKMTVLSAYVHVMSLQIIIASLKLEISKINILAYTKQVLVKNYVPGDYNLLAYCHQLHGANDVLSNL
jgi:hypothetical protein